MIQKPLYRQFVGSASRRIGSLIAGAAGTVVYLSPEAENAIIVLVAGAVAYVSDLLVSVGTERGWF